MDNKLEEKVLIVQASNEKLASEFTEMKSDITDIKTTFKQIIAQKHHSSPGNMDSPKAQDTETLFLYTNKAPPLEGGNYMKIGGMWNIKHEIRLSKFFELLTKI